MLGSITAKELFYCALTMAIALIISCLQGEKAIAFHLTGEQAKLECRDYRQADGVKVSEIFEWSDPENYNEAFKLEGAIKFRTYRLPRLLASKEYQTDSDFRKLVDTLNCLSEAVEWNNLRESLET